MGSADSVRAPGAAQGSIGCGGGPGSGAGTLAPSAVGSEPAPMVAQLFGARVACEGAGEAAPARGAAGLGAADFDAAGFGAAGFGSAGFAATVRVAGGGSGTGLAVSSNGAGRAWVFEAHGAGRSGGGSGTAVEVTGRAAPSTGTLTLVVAVRIAVEVLAGLAGATGRSGGAPPSGISKRISFPHEQR